MRPFFPIQRDDKESRFYRAMFFHRRQRRVLEALDKFIVEQQNRAHPEARIGGVMLLEPAHPDPAARGRRSSGISGCRSATIRRRSSASTGTSRVGRADAPLRGGERAMKRPPPEVTWWTRLRDWLDAPQPIERLALARIVLPLVLLSFQSSRLVHADHWLRPIGFRVPYLGGRDWRQPLYIPPVSPGLAWTIAAGTVVERALSLGGVHDPRAAGALFAALMAYLALADRLEAFTVSKLGPMLALALCLSPSGARYGLDAWRRRRRDPAAAAADARERRRHSLLPDLSLRDVLGRRDRQAARRLAGGRRALESPARQLPDDDLLGACRARSRGGGGRRCSTCR